jgi:DNA-binding NarL/FixJ family response regulator
LALTSGDGVRFVLHWTDSQAGGFERLTRGGIDVVLLDLSLPDSSGVETFLSLRDRQRPGSGEPVSRLELASAERRFGRFLESDRYGKLAADFSLRRGREYRRRHRLD